MLAKIRAMFSAERREERRVRRATSKHLPVDESSHLEGHTQSATLRRGTHQQWNGPR